MRILLDIKRHKSKITSSIKKFGFSPEHNYYEYLYTQTPYEKCVFFNFGEKKGLMALHRKRDNVWYATNGILAPSEERLEIFMKFVKYALVRKKAKKIVAEFGKDFKSQFCRALKGMKYKVSMNYTLYWPVYNLKGRDEKLRGRKWKKLRNIRNRFYSNFKVKAINPKKIDKNTIRKILFLWLKRRSSTSRVDYNYYLNVIDNKFIGFDVARGLSINGEPCSISAGWKIPNSDDFYLGIGIFNYRYKDLGEFVNLDDLMYLKKKGYRNVDLGGSDKALLSFKKKFKPDKIYKTYVFSISRKK